MGAGQYIPSQDEFRNNAVWVDNVYGDDTTGEVHKPNQPYATINAAYNALRFSVGATAFHVYVNASSTPYEVTAGLGLQNGQTAYIIGEDGGASPTVIFSSNINVGEFVNVIKELHIENINIVRNISAEFAQSYSTSTRRVRVSLKNCTVTDNGGGGCIHLRSVVRMENCTIIANVGEIFQAANEGLAESPKYINCTFSSVTDDIFTGNINRAVVFDNCVFDSPTGWFYNGNPTSLRVQLYDCKISSFSGIIRSRLGFANFYGMNYLESLNPSSVAPIAIFDNDESNVNHVIENLVIRQEETNLSSSITKGNAGKSDIIVMGQLFLSEAPPQTRLWQIGGEINAVVVGEVITFDLPSPYNTAPITYTVQAGDTVDGIALIIRDLIRTQINTPSTIWEFWTDGDDTKAEVYEGGTPGVLNVVRVEMSGSVPALPIMQLGNGGSTSNHVTGDQGSVGDDYITGAGLVNQGQGEIDVLPRTLLDSMDFINKNIGRN